MWVMTSNSVGEGCDYEREHEGESTSMPEHQSLGSTPDIYHANSVEDSSLIVRYKRFLELEDDIALCLELTASTGEPHCLAVEGTTGAGKSTLARAYISTHPPVETKYGMRLTTFLFSVPSPTTVKSVAEAMLKALGDPAAHYGSEMSKTRRLVKLLKEYGVKLVILDEIQHLYDSKTKRVLAKVSDWLKTLIKDTKIPFVFLGIQGEVELILKANPQLSRLFAARETLHPLVYDVTDEYEMEANQEFRRFLLLAEETIGMCLDRWLYTHTELFNIYEATNGVVGNIISLLQLARIYASRRGGTQIEKADLALAYSKRLGKHLRKPNPFLPEAAGSSGPYDNYTIQCEPAEHISQDNNMDRPETLARMAGKARQQRRGGKGKKEKPVRKGAVSRVEGGNGVTKGIEGVEISADTAEAGRARQQYEEGVS